MTATTDRLNLPAHLDLDHLTAQAAVTADLLTHEHAVQVALTPGDATVYHVLIVRKAATVIAGREHPYSAPGEWIVCLLNLDGWSVSWPIESGPPHWSYVLGRWTDHEHTAKVLAAFLRLLWDELRVDGGEPFS